MKQALLIVLSVVFLNVAKAQNQVTADTSYWNNSGNLNINFTQVSLTNWSAGGQNSVAGVAKLNYLSKYEKGNISWENKFDLGYGLSKVEGIGVQKSEDIIDLLSKFGLKMNEQWNYSGLLTFNTQFAPGYSTMENIDKTSDFLAPAFMVLALGLEYVPGEQFSLMLSPISSKLTIVSDDEIDATNYGLESEDATTRFELGATVKALLNITIVENTDLTSELSLFSNYLDQPQNIDVDWKVGINMKVNDYLSAQVNTRLIYDADVIDPVDNKAKIQFKELLGIGFNIKF